jgi:putative flippase GtrA
MTAQVLRFGAVGGVATLAHVLVAVLAERALAVGPQQANLVGFLTALLVSYFGHGNYTFPSGRSPSEQFLRFALVALATYVSSSLTVALCTQSLGLPFALAMVPVAVVVPAASFLAMRFWVFQSDTIVVFARLRGAALSAVITLAMGVLFIGKPLTNDVVWYLIATREWLGGAPLYETIMEVNPPLNFYLTVPAIFLADHLGIGDDVAQYLVIWMLLFVSLYWCSAIIGTDFDLPPIRQALLLIGLGVAMTVSALDSVGQREFFLVLLLMPWLLTQVADRPKLIGREIATASVAAIGVCLKPHFVLFPLAVTLVWVLRTRSLRPVLSSSNMVFLAAGLAYVGYVAVIHPAYLNDIVPIAQLVYGGYRAEPEVVFGLFYREFLLIALPAGIALVDRNKRFDSHPLVAATIAGFLCYSLQAKGFGYHLIPFLAFGLVACLLVIVHVRTVGPVVVACGVAWVGVIGIMAGEGFHRSYSVEMAKRVKRDLVEFDSVIALTTNLGAGPPVAFETGTRWASRYPTNWLVPGALNELAKTDCAAEAKLCARLRDIADRNRSDNIEDMIAYKPDLLIVDRYSGYFDVERFDWLAFMDEDPAWAAVFSQYAMVGYSQRYDYYARKQD